MSLEYPLEAHIRESQEALAHPWEKALSLSLLGHQ